MELILEKIGSMGGGISFDFGFRKHKSMKLWTNMGQVNV